jgi:hypothetical protein
VVGPPLLEKRRGNTFIQSIVNQRKSEEDNFPLLSKEGWPDYKTQYNR